MKLCIRNILNKCIYVTGGDTKWSDLWQMNY